MAKPLQLITILSQMTRQIDTEHLECQVCNGQGENLGFHPETGHEMQECPECLGSGFNTLGLIMNQILNLPDEGYGPVELRQALASKQKLEETKKHSPKKKHRPKHKQEH